MSHVNSVIDQYQWKHPQDAYNFQRWLKNPHYTRYYVRAHIAWRPSLYTLFALPACASIVGVTQLNTSKWAQFRYPTKGFVLEKKPVV